MSNLTAGQVVCAPFTAANGAAVVTPGSDQRIRVLAIFITLGTATTSSVQLQTTEDGVILGPFNANSTVHIELAPTDHAWGETSTAGQALTAATTGGGVLSGQIIYALV